MIKLFVEIFKLAYTLIFELLKFTLWLIFKIYYYIFKFIIWLTKCTINFIKYGKFTSSYCTYDFDDIDDLSGIEFEHFVAKKLLPNMGFHNIKRTQDSVDFGVDVLASKNGYNYAIQCKRYSKPVGVKAVQEVIAGMIYYNCSIGMVISNNRYTPSAQKLALKSGITLIGREEIMKYKIDNNKNEIEEQEEF